MNHQTPSPRKKRQSVERHSRESSLKNNDNINIEPNESNRLRHPLENPRSQSWADEVEIVESPFRNPSSSTPMSSFDHGDHPSSTVNPLPSTPKSTCLDPEILSHMGDSEPITSVIPLQKTSTMETPTPIQPPKPVRRMLFKPVLPGRRNQPKTSSVQLSTLLTSDSAEPLSTSLSVVDGHSKKDELEVTSRAQDVVLLQEKPISPRPRPPLLSRNCTPTSLPPRHHRDAQGIDVPDTRVSLSKNENCGNATDTTDPDAELVVDLLLPGTPEEPHNCNCISNPLQQEIVEDLLLHKRHEDGNDKDDVSAVKDTAAVEGLATQFLQRSATLFFSFEEYSIVS